MGERRPCTAEVTGSSPVRYTMICREILFCEPSGRPPKRPFTTILQISGQPASASCIAARLAPLEHADAIAHRQEDERDDRIHRQSGTQLARSVY